MNQEQESPTIAVLRLVVGVCQITTNQKAIQMTIITAGKNQFQNVDELIKKSVTNNSYVYCFNWGSDTVIKFEDGEKASSKMVEVQFFQKVDCAIEPEEFGAIVVIGTPAKYKEYEFQDWRSALQTADKLASDYVARTDWSLDRFLNYAACAMDV
jgi:hypothetical protein